MMLSLDQMKYIPGHLALFGFDPVRDSPEYNGTPRPKFDGDNGNGDLKKSIAIVIAFIIFCLLVVTILPLIIMWSC